MAKQRGSNVHQKPSVALNKNYMSASLIKKPTENQMNNLELDR